MASAADASPIDDRDLNHLFAGIPAAAPVALAVSGGADSTALMLLAFRWAAAHPSSPQLFVLTVDHGLRPEAAQEAAQVQAQAESIGLPHRTLRWTGPKPDANLQEAARDARYRLLAQAAIDAGAATLLTAHTLDDQAETLLLALARGSGLYGLAAMPRQRPLGPLQLVRPLLAIPKSRLITTLRAANWVWSEDPGNSSDRYARSRLRKEMPALARLGLTPARLAETARSMARAAAAIDHNVDAILATALTRHSPSLLQLTPAPWLAAPEEVRLRLIARLIREVSREPHGPRFDRLQRLMQACVAATRANSPLRRTLGGTIAEVWHPPGRNHRSGQPPARSLWLYAEAGRDGFPVTELDPGNSAIWDDRIRWHLGPNATRPVTLRALGPDGRRRLAPGLPPFPPRAIESLPSAWCDDQLLAAPDLGIVAGPNWPLTSAFIARERDPNPEAEQPDTA